MIGNMSALRLLILIRGGGFNPQILPCRYSGIELSAGN